MKICRYCKEHKDMQAFRVVSNGTGFFRQKTCKDCSEIFNPNYHVRREKELALIPNPFDKRITSVETNHHLTIWNAL